MIRFSSIPVLAVPLVAALWIPGCSDAKREPSSEPGAENPAAVGPARPGTSRGPLDGILLVTIDTARADAFGCYGGPAATPVIDTLAARGVLFRHAISSTPVTHPSHTSLMTGLYPPRHGVRDNGLFRLGDNAETLAEVFKEHGWRTAAFVSAIVLDGRCGLGQGFDHYDDRLREEKGAANWRERRADATVDRAIAHIQAGPHSVPLFIWVHLFDPHSPYAPPEPFAGRYRDNPYYGEIAFADQQVGRLLEAFRKAHPTGIVAVTSDHGEALGHREPSHGLLLYQDTIQIPLVIAGAGLPQGAEVTDLVGLIDLFPTLLDLGGLPAPEPIEGYDLLGRLDGSPRPEPVFLETLLPHYSYGWSGLYGVCTDRYKYVLGSDETELFDLKTDPGEQKNMADRKLDVSRDLSRTLDRLLSRPPVCASHEVTQEASTRQALESLGYVSSGKPREEPGQVLTGPDPRRMARMVLAHSQAAALISDGNYPEARRILETLLSKDRRNPLFRQSYGRVLTLMGDYQEAKAQLQQVLRERPDRPGVSYHLALCHEGLGDTEAAEQAYHAVLALAPQHAAARFHLADLLWRQERKNEARRLYREFLALNPSKEDEVRLAHERLGE